MKTILNWRNAKLRRSAVAIGVFDGVHLGHRAILGAAAAEARKKNLSLVALTMNPHPSQVLHPERRTPLLYSLDHRLELLKDLGVATTVVLKFNRAVAGMKAEQFVARILTGCLGAKAVAVGEDFRFGQGAKGDVKFLTSIGQREGFSVRAVEPVRGDGQVISSSRIREAVQSGRFGTASKLLGRPYGLFGTVVRGDGRGRKLGFPTINLRLDHELLPPPGVYAVWAKTGGRAYPGALHLGPRPTFDAPEPRVECHLLKTPSQDLYGRRFELIPVRKIRPVLRFASPEGLARQIAMDVQSARSALQSPLRKVY